MERDFRSTQRKGRFAKLAEEKVFGEYAMERIEEHANEREICGVEICFSQERKGDFQSTQRKVRFAKTVKRYIFPKDAVQRDYIEPHRKESWVNKKKKLIVCKELATGKRYLWIIT